MTTYESLPDDLPVPEDDGAAEHLPGMAMPQLTLAATDGAAVDLSALGPGRTVLYLYPLSGKPGIDLPDGWDAIPGARGCTPEACGFRDHIAELRDAGAGACTASPAQDTDYQSEFGDAHAPARSRSCRTPICASVSSAAAADVRGGRTTLYKRLTMIILDGRDRARLLSDLPPGSTRRRGGQLAAGTPGPVNDRVAPVRALARSQICAVRGAPRRARIEMSHRDTKDGGRMGTITTPDGTEIFYKDWGSGQPIVFSHGWPLSADDWDTQMLFFLQHGYRVIAHDRRGHGRSTQIGDGHDMDHYADDLAAVTEHLDLHDADPRRALHRRRRGRALHRPPRREPRRQGGADQRGAAADGADRRQPRRPAQERLRRPPGPARRQPVGVLPRAAVGPVLRLQPARRRAVGGDHRELVAPGDDGRRQGPLRRHRRLLADRLHRGPQEDHACRSWSCTATTTRSSPTPTPGPLSAKLAAERDAEDLRGLPARHADHRRPTTINADLLAFIQS